ncbi:hypothetical protein PHYSODRAFT_305440 [Phytophthora sojae]|uniref:Uncharacterized protein n=1 Tax=Phytophthora sojae (strain P6497) TaxID=1094619 RepID=G5A3H1_PHYSP|nr:hypothetical protein PHYSODRAFT_305440 [Phytophthora sojae]EGZ10187.1 hypothetical protein PHYSODRAFT_305440 [Phytophthora sojae]|eukprot:XP_009535048.1 hypothetical protein PHYSODRAFT_305440 [Phytophthora sojae]
MDDTSTPRAWLSVCGECDKSLKLGKLPKFSIANGFFVGRLCVVDAGEESAVVERRMGLSDESSPVMAKEHPVTGKVGGQHERKFEIQRSDTMANDVAGDHFARMFPHLFPFGRGHPGEVRDVPESVLACMKYYAMLSERQFAEVEIF